MQTQYCKSNTSVHVVADPCRYPMQAEHAWLSHSEDPPLPARRHPPHLPRHHDSRLHGQRPSSRPRRPAASASQLGRAVPPIVSPGWVRQHHTARAPAAHRLQGQAASREQHSWGGGCRPGALLRHWGGGAGCKALRCFACQNADCLQALCGMPGGHPVAGGCGLLVPLLLIVESV